MTGNSINEQFEIAEKIYTEEEDQEMLKIQRKLFNELSDINLFAESAAGRQLISSIKEDLTKSLVLLFETRKGRHLSDAESLFNLLTKLTTAKSKSEAIRDWLNSLS